MFSLWYSVLTALVLQAANGSRCPEGWEGRGWLLQDTEDTNPSNDRSEILHIDGLVSPSNAIRSFCVKTTAASQEPDWPRGKYCIYRKRGENTTTGMRAGSIKMYDETTFNKDTAIYDSYNNWIYYSLSDTYQHLVLYFQCQKSGNKKIPISLPITKPFYLLPYESRGCQQVKWMVATSEWIKYHTNNYKGRNYKNGAVPYHELGNVRNNKGITMYYCYYQSCNYTLTDKKGVFQSPGFPGKYPDGQLCSWRIMVPDKHTLRVHFTNFSLNGNDTKDFLESYNYFNGSFQLTATLHGFRERFTLTVTSDLLFKFISNEEGHSLGFRAEYTVFIPEETTTQPPSSTPGASSSPNTNTTEPHSSTTRTPSLSTTNTAKTSTTESMSKNRTAFARQAQCNNIGTIVVIVIPLACLVFVIIVIGIVVRRYRIEDKIATNPIYDQGDILLKERASITTVCTTMDSNGGEMYQTLSRDPKTTANDKDSSNGQMYQSLARDQKPGYDGRNKIDDSSVDSGYPKYHELEPMDNKVPDVVYDVFPSPNPDDGPSDDPMYQAVDEQTTNESLYQYTMPGTMVTQNRLYDSLA